ncbi:MAG: protein-methionine-sulfoxide reductase catalytic subunit MsrP, partial [Hylemonella sp.]|nr:protein-methionine-sulfoxide reductase catalytic subunit MsrP [Hylemonella sp.]
MLIKTSHAGFDHPLSSEITSPDTYHSRRALMRLMAGGVAGATLGAWASRDARAQMAMASRPGK